MSSTRPLLICLTSTRNYGWVTSVFLKANSLWADYIIMVDQMSTDGTRELALKNSKVILLDNEDLSYSETKRSEMAINRARKIDGDKILIYLAIDEILSANFSQTSDWKRIVESKPKDVFCLTWANMLPDNKHYFSFYKSVNEPFWMARIFHDDGLTPYNNEGLDMHTHCIPYPEANFDEYCINDFRILHYAFYNEKLNLAKQRFYQFIDYDKNKRTATSLSRMYKRSNKVQDYKEIPIEWFYLKDQYGFDMFDEIDLNSISFFDKYVIEFINRNGINHYKKINVWDKEFLDHYKIKDPRSTIIKLIHGYYNCSSPYHKTFFVRAVDKLLKKLGV